jgi:DNA-binding winged helix-turn-helix (wHTH) protein
MVVRQGTAVPLPSKTFEVLLYLVANAGRVVTKDELLKAIWPDSFVEEGNLTQHVFRLRKTLQPEADDSPYIVTIPGQGYQFSAVVDSGPALTTTPETIGVPEEIVVQTIRERSTVVAEEFLRSAPPALTFARRPHWPTLTALPVSAIALTALVFWGWNGWRRSVQGPPVPIVVSFQRFVD